MITSLRRLEKDDQPKHIIDVYEAIDIPIKDMYQINRNVYLIHADTEQGCAVILWWRRQDGHYIVADSNYSETDIILESLSNLIHCDFSQFYRE